jgi:hypothetical protein
MAKLDVWALPRYERPEVSRTFTHHGTDFPLTCTFRKLNGAERALVADEVKLLVEDYLTGSVDRGAADFPDPEGEVTPTQALFSECALLSRSEVDEHARLTPIEWALVSVRQPDNFEAARGLFYEVNAGGEAANPGGSPGAPAATSAASRSSKAKSSRG